MRHYTFQKQNTFQHNNFNNTLNVTYYVAVVNHHDFLEHISERYFGIHHML